MQVLVSLHDVTPAHRARLDRAEALLAGAGVDRVAYLVVPDYHRGHAIADDRAFRDWCARPRPFSVEWVLHGYYHLDDRHAASGGREWLARRLMTAGEGEFLTLDADRQRERLRRGRQAVEAATGATPRAFVAPAWLFNGTLVRTLSDEGFRYTEDHWHIVDVARGVSHACPAITWATRTFVRRIGSRVVCPAALRWLRREPAIRIAIHPFDMDHPRTADQIRRVLARALRDRTPAGYDDLGQN